MDRSISPTIKSLMIACVGAFLLQQLVVGDQMIELFGLVPADVIHKRWVWQLVTYMFLHGNMWHLLLNLFAFWMFGRVVEDSWGSAEFLKYCLICGLGAAAFNIALTPNSMNPIIGASGVVYGLVVAFAMLYPDTMVYLYFFIPIKAKYFALLFALLEFMASATGTGGNVANLAHLGGMLTGYLYIRWWWEIKFRTKTIATDLWEKVAETAQSPAGGWRRRGDREQPSEPNLSEEVDRILDKILVQGVDSLTPEEKETMRKYSNKQRYDA